MRCTTMPPKIESHGTVECGLCSRRSRESQIDLVQDMEWPHGFAPSSEALGPFLVSRFRGNFGPRLTLPTVYWSCAVRVFSRAVSHSALEIEGCRCRPHDYPRAGLLGAPRSMRIRRSCHINRFR